MLFYYDVYNLARHYYHLDDVATCHIFGSLLHRTHVAFHFFPGHRLLELYGKAGLAVERHCICAAVLNGVFSLWPRAAQSSSEI